MRVPTNEIVMRDRLGRVLSGAGGITIERVSDAEPALIYSSRVGLATVPQSQLTTDQNGYLGIDSSATPGWIKPEVYRVNGPTSFTWSAGGGAKPEIDLREFGENMDVTGTDSVSPFFTTAWSEIPTIYGAQPVTLRAPWGKLAIDQPIEPTIAGTSIKTGGKRATEFYIPAGAGFNTHLRYTEDDISVDPCTLATDNTVTAAPSVYVDGCFRASGSFYFDGVPQAFVFGPTAVVSAPTFMHNRGTWNADLSMEAILVYRLFGVRMLSNLQGRGTLGFPQKAMMAILSQGGCDGGHWDVALQYIPTGAKSAIGGYLYGLLWDATNGSIVNQDQEACTFDHASLAPFFTKSNGGVDEMRYNRPPKRLTPDRGDQHTRSVGCLITFNGTNSPFEGNHFDGRSLLVGAAARGVIVSAGNKVHESRVNADGGTLTYGVAVGGGAVSNTAAIAFDAWPDAAYTDAGYAASVQGKLEALPNVGVGNVRVVGGVGAGGGDSIPFKIIWCGTLANRDDIVLTANGASLTLTGGGASVTVTTELAGQTLDLIKDFALTDCPLTCAITGAGVPAREAMITIISEGVTLLGNRMASTGTSDSIIKTSHFVEVLKDAAGYTIVGNRAPAISGAFATFKTPPSTNQQVIANNSPGDSDRIARIPAFITHAARLALSPPDFGALVKETDTGLRYVYNGSWQQLDPTGQVRKTADQSVSNQGALVDDTELKWPIEVNEDWFVIAHILTTAVSITADWRFAIDGPTGATGWWESFLSGHLVPLGTAGTPVVLQALGNGGTFGAVVGNQKFLLHGRVKADATHSGFGKLRVGQAVATVEADLILAGSWLELRRML